MTRARVVVGELEPAAERTLRRQLHSWSRFHRALGSEDFDDMYQEAWLKLLEGERKGRPTRNRDEALRWALNNSWLGELRRRRRRPAIALDRAPATALATPAASDPAERAELLEAARCLFEAVGGVTERQRQIVLLADVGGLRPREVQRRLAISERTYQRDHAGALRTIGARLGELLEGTPRERSPVEASR